jgi:hypothetical protein
VFAATICAVAILKFIREHHCVLGLTELRVRHLLSELKVAPNSAVVAGGQARTNSHWVTIAHLRSRLIADLHRSDQVLILVARCLLLVRSLRMWPPVSLKHQHVSRRLQILLRRHRLELAIHITNLNINHFCHLLVSVSLIVSWIEFGCLNALFSRRVVQRVRLPAQELCQV